MRHLKKAGFITVTILLIFFIAFKVYVGKRNALLAGEMVYVKGETFTMGCTPEQGSDCSRNETPARETTLGDFYIGKYEVTRTQWKAVMMEDDPSKFREDGNLPVENVSWNNVQAFIRKLNEITGGNYRLPTEAEWEYAARGGRQSKGYRYSGSDAVEEIAWRGDGTTHPVGTKTANELGIHDMSGNVFEWVNDWYGNYDDGPLTDPRGPESGLYRVTRGGGWNGAAWQMRVSYRRNYYPDSCFAYIGFRLARDAKR